MLSHNDFLEATRRFKDKKTKPHARTRYHALLLVSKGYSSRQTADILFVDPESVSRWVAQYDEAGLDGLPQSSTLGWGAWAAQARQRAIGPARYVAR